MDLAALNAGDLPGRPPIVARLALLAGLSVLLSACGEPGTDAGEPGRPTAGGTAVVAFNADMQSFNPLVNTDQNTMEVNSYMLFTPLVQYDSMFQPRPYLARRWDLEDRAVTFHLARDVRWHDGRPVTAHDVKFTFDRAKDPETASILGSVYLQLVESAEVIDSFTVRFEFTRPHARPLDGFWWAPVPRHLFQDIPSAELGQAAFNREPIGSGPFRFVRWEAGQRVVLERNPDFAPSLGRPARLDRVVFRFVQEATTLLSETVTGRVDVNGSLFPHQAEEVRRAEGVRLIAFPSREYYYIGWNTRRDLFSEPSVRRALTLSIDRVELIDALLFGFGQPAVGTIAPWHPLYTEIEALPHDPERAAELLEAAGWVDRDGDGVREDARDRPFEFTLMTNIENPVRVDIAQVVQSDLAAIGVRAEVRTLEWQTLLSRHRGRDFDAVVQSWVLDNFRVDPYALFHSSEAERPGSYNRGGFANARVDSLIEAARRTSDAAAARRLWADFARAIRDAQPFTFLMWLDELSAVSDRVRGVDMDARGVLVEVSDWWIPRDRR